MKILKNNGLSIAFFLLFAISLIGQIATGLKEHNSEIAEKSGQQLNLPQYLSSGHFLQSTFENWESEFFQMALFVIPYHFPAPERLVRIEANGGKGGG